MNAMHRTLDHIRRFALGFPETREDHPWGESAIKVRGKTFVFLGGPEGELRMSVKLPQSREFALEYPFTEPTPYGLGKSGWVTACFAPNSKPPLDILEAWVVESYRAIAPRSVAAKVMPDGAGERKATAPARPKAKRRASSARKSR